MNKASIQLGAPMLSEAALSCYCFSVNPISQEYKFTQSKGGKTQAYKAKVAA